MALTGRSRRHGTHGRRSSETACNHIGPQAGRLLDSLLTRSSEADNGIGVMPERYWSVLPATDDEIDSGRLRLRGAVLVRIPGRMPSTATAGTGTGRESPSSEISPDLRAALEEPQVRPGQVLARLVRADGRTLPLILAGGALLAAGGVVFEALLFRGFFDIGRELGVTSQRLGALGVLSAFLLAMLLLELPLTEGVLRLGRKLEARLRIFFLKIPRLGDRYFRSRLTSDMAERCHSVHRLRNLPRLGEGLLRAAFESALTASGIIWLDPGAAPLALGTAAAGLLIPLFAMPPIQEWDFRVRTHLGALSRFYLDALLGLVPVRTHTADRALRREHESLVVEWARAHLTRDRATVVLESALQPILLLLITLLLFGHVGRAGHGGGTLLLVFWALNLFALSRVVTLVLAQQYPTHHNLTLRLLEPLGAREEGGILSATPTVEEPPSAPKSGVDISFRSVQIRAGGHTLLHDFDLQIPPGTHLAVVGPSGAGKSTLAACLLGWHRAVSGEILVEGRRLADEHLAALRRATAWVDPDIQLWNRSLARNLSYGNDQPQQREIGWVIRQADLVDLLQGLPEGLQTPLGESGALVSGGEGQRVRLGRAFGRSAVRLVILDEPFRGLARRQRRDLLDRVRSLWRHATLVCITHDIWQTSQFDQVLVMDAGTAVEVGRPEVLVSEPQSRFRELLKAEARIAQRLWSDSGWKKFHLEAQALRPENEGRAQT